jgi:hypothetical protein
MTSLGDRVSTQRFGLDAARGVLGNVEPVNIFGFNRAVGTSFETLWNNGGTYSYLSDEQQLSVVSDDAGDTMDVLIQGLDGNYSEVEETVTLTGTDAVTTTNSFLRVNNAIILSGENAGDITGSYSGTDVFFIEEALGTTQACVYTVPAGHSLYLFRIDLTSGTTNFNRFLTYRNRLDSENGRVLRVAEATWESGQQSFNRQIPFKISEKTDFQFEAKSSGSQNEVSIFIEAILVDD